MTNITQEKTQQTTHANTRLTVHHYTKLTLLVEVCSGTKVSVEFMMTGLPVEQMKSSEGEWTNPQMENEKFSKGFKNVIKIMCTILPNMQKSLIFKNLLLLKTYFASILNPIVSKSRFWWLVYFTSQPFKCPTTDFGGQRQLV